MTGFLALVEKPKRIKESDPYTRYDSKWKLHKRPKSIYVCSCWKEFLSLDTVIKTWRRTSCWCIWKINTAKANKKRSTHNLTNHRLYSTWVCMIHRCENPNRKSYENYWWRWIKVCERRKDVSLFIHDMYPSYKKWLTLDRIDNDWDYCKDNCRRSTYKKQANNSRKNKMYKWKSMSQRADEIYISYYCLRSRLQSGRSREQAILTPKWERKKWLQEHS